LKADEYFRKEARKDIKLQNAANRLNRASIGYRFYTNELSIVGAQHMVADKVNYLYLYLIVGHF